VARTRDIHIECLIMTRRCFHASSNVIRFLPYAALYAKTAEMLMDVDVPKPRTTPMPTRRLP